MKSRCELMHPAIGIAVMLLLPLFFAHGRGDRRSTLDLEFHEGTDMEASPSPDGRHLGLCGQLG